MKRIFSDIKQKIKKRDINYIQYLRQIILIVVIIDVLFSFIGKKISKNSKEYKSPLLFQKKIFSRYPYQGKVKGILEVSFAKEKNKGLVFISKNNSHLNFELPINNVKIQANSKNILQAKNIEFNSPGKNIQARYKLIPNGLKEEIILNKIPSTNKFPIKLNLKNLKMKIAYGGIPVFYDLQGKYLFHFSRPYAKDKRGKITYGVKYVFQKTKTNFIRKKIKNNAKEIKQKLLTSSQVIEGKDFLLSIEVDRSWLNDKKRVLPIIIDPTVVHDTSSEFATGQLNRVTDTGAGSLPSLETYYQELPADEHTVGLWHMNETADNSCSGGEDACDSSGNGNHGTATGTTITDGKLSKARSFNGTSDQITISNNVGDGQDQISIETWVYFNSLSTDTLATTSHADGQQLISSVLIDDAWLINEGGGELAFYTDTGTDVTILTQNSPITTGKWYHVAATYDGYTMKIYIDGKLVSSGAQTGTIINPGNTQYIGSAGSRSWSEPFDGLIDEVRISNIARTPEEIKTSASRRPYSIYTSDVIDLTTVDQWTSLSWDEWGVATGDGETLKDSTNLVAQWNFNETSGTTASVTAGSCGTSCNGTLSGFDSTASQDADPDSSWTANNRRWGAGALQFDGVDSKVDVGNMGTFGSQINTSTFETWIKTSDTSTNKAIAKIIDSSGQTSDVVYGIEPNRYLSSGCTLGVSAGKTLFYIRDNTGKMFAKDINSNIYDSQWHHLVWVINDASSNSMAVYVDGVSQSLSGDCSQSPSSFNNWTTTLNIGASNNRGTSEGFFSGIIDSTRIYSRALSASEIMANYNAGNIEFQTRVGSDTSPNDGSWDAWAPTTGETVIDNMDNPLDWATPSASLYSGVPIATSSSSVIKAEGNGSLKITTGQLSITDNLRGYWTFDETTGNAYNSTALTGLTLTNNNSATRTSSNFGRAISLDGSTQYFNCTDANCGGTSKLDPLSTAGWSMGAWVYADSFPGTAPMIMAKDFNPGPLLMVNTSGQVRAEMGNSTCSNDSGLLYQSAAVVPLQQWTLVTMTVSASNPGVLKIYINGELKYTSSTVAYYCDSAGDFRIGYAGASGYYWDGKIDEAFVYGSTLNNEEVAEIYRAGRDHYINKTITPTDLSSKSTLPFYIAADRPGTYLEATVGESAYANYQPDSNTAGLWHLEEESGSGAYIKDSSGNGNHGTPTGTTFSQGKIGKARYFDDSADYITVTDSTDSSLDVTTALTMEAWIKHDVSGVFDGIMQKGSIASSLGLYEIHVTNSDKIRAVLNGDTTNALVDSVSTINTNQWYHVTVTYDQSYIKLYLNGKLETTKAYSTAISTDNNSLYMGLYYDSSSYLFNGTIDEVRISNTARTADEIRQAYEVGLRTHPITIDFSASLDSGNLITNSADLSFTIDATTYGLDQKGSALYQGDKIIVRENDSGTEYIAQGTVTAVTASTGAVTVASWDSGSTFPSSGFTTSADVFKWQHEYWSIADNTLSTHIDAITNLTFRLTNGFEGRTIWLDDFNSNSSYLTDPTGSTITSSTGNQYFQYRAIITSLDEAVSATLSAVTVDYIDNLAPNTPSLDSPTDTATNQSLLTVLKTTTTDYDSDYLQYKIELCTDSAMTLNCQTFNQTSSQTGWSGQDTQTNTAYTSGTQAVYTLQTALSTSTTYYWRSYAIDPGGTNTWSSTQGTPYSFTTTNPPSAPTSPYAEGQTNPSGIADLTPEFSAIHNDPDGDSADYYQIEVNTASDFTGTVMWDSGQTSMATLLDGARSTDVSYAGTTLSYDGSTYYWRIRFWDINGAQGAVSATQSFSTNQPVVTPSLDSPTDTATNQSLLTVLKTTTTDYDSDYLQYKIELCTDSAMTLNCQTFNQTSSQTGWSGQDTQTNTAYTSGTQAVYTLQTALSTSTTYYWRSYAIDPGGTNTWSSTQGTPYSFTTKSTPETPTSCTIEESSNDGQLTVSWIDNATNEDGYEIKRSVDGGSFSTLQTIAADTSSYADTSTSQDHTYQYQIASFIDGKSYSSWCTTSTLNLGVGNLNLDGINLENLNIN